MLNNVNEKASSILSRYCGLAILSLCAVLGGDASAQTSEKYLSYTADINGDGQLDILVKPVPRVIMVSLDDDFDVPIAAPLVIPAFLLLSNGNGSYQFSTDVGPVMANPSWAQGLVNVTNNSGQSSGGASITISYVASNQLPSIVSKASDGTISLTQAGSAPPANNVPYPAHKCGEP